MLRLTYSGDSVSINFKHLKLLQVYSLYIFIGSLLQKIKPLTKIYLDEQVPKAQFCICLGKQHRKCLQVILVNSQN